MQAATRLSYLGLLAWQVAWHLVLPEPLGARSGWLAALAALPLLLPLGGVLRLRHRSLVWAAYLSVFYFMVGVMEAWSNPPQRIAACVQIAVVGVYLLAMVLVSRRG